MDGREVDVAHDAVDLDYILPCDVRVAPLLPGSNPQSETTR